MVPRPCPRPLSAPEARALCGGTRWAGARSMRPPTMSGHFLLAPIPESSSDYLLPKDIRLAVLGAGRVGKSAMIVRFLTKRFIGDYEPNTGKLYSRLVCVEGDQLSLQIQDTPGGIQVRTARSREPTRIQTPSGLRSASRVSDAPAVHSDVGVGCPQVGPVFGVLETLMGGHGGSIVGGSFLLLVHHLAKGERRLISLCSPTGGCHHLDGSHRLFQSSAMERLTSSSVSSCSLKSGIGIR